MRELVERWYSNSFYPVIQHEVTSVTNLVPVAVLDFLTVAAAVGLALLWWRAMRAGSGRRWRALGRAAWVTMASALVVYLLFEVLWGLNYYRLRLADTLVLDGPAPTTTAVAELGRRTVANLNELYGPAHSEGWREAPWKNQSLTAASAEVQRALGARRTAVPGRLKVSLWGLVFRWNGVDGMVNPLGLEVIANPDLLPFERPFVAAHEWSHLAGYADESEANFIGWLTCLRADVASQYSGWLYLHWQVLGELPAGVGARVGRELQAGPRGDLDAITRRLQRDDWPMLRRVSWAAYDQYLKANAVPSGVRNYGEVVTLIVRAHFEDGWRPTRRGRAR
jgi:hypothetical protein